MKSLNLAVLSVLLFSSLSSAYTITWSWSNPAEYSEYVAESRDSAGNYHLIDDTSHYERGMYQFKITPDAGESSAFLAALSVTTTEVVSLSPAGNASLSLNMRYMLTDNPVASTFLIDKVLATPSLSGGNVTNLANTLITYDTVTLQTGLDYYVFLDASPEFFASVRQNMGPGSSGRSAFRATSVFDLQEAAPVPEPSAILLFGAGLGAFALWRRRVRR